MSDVRRSRRGVYYDLDVSPYEYKSPYGDIFKFSSAKKLEIFSRDVKKEVKRVDDILERNALCGYLPDEITTLIRRNVYRAFYASNER